MPPILDGTVDVGRPLRLARARTALHDLRRVNRNLHLVDLDELAENERIEAKADSEIGKSPMETVCAFANEPGLGGGRLFLGAVRDELALLPSCEIEGLGQPDECSADRFKREVLEPAMSRQG